MIREPILGLTMALVYLSVLSRDLATSVTAQIKSEDKKPGDSTYSTGRTVLPDNKGVYVNTNVQVGDINHLKVFANPDAPEEWFNLHDPEGAVFGYPLIGEFDELGPRREAGSADEHDVPKAEE